MMIPVLAVDDPTAACEQLARHFGFQRQDGLMWLGTQAIAVLKAGDIPAGFLPLPLDHVALSVTDAAEAGRLFAARGGTYATSYTPDGPREIPEFWDNGVRFVFFNGPMGAPLEFCETIGVASNPTEIGHDHYGIRRVDFESAIPELQQLGATQIARYRLGSNSDVVNVMFLNWNGSVLELFDEPPTHSPRSHGWTGFLHITEANDRQP